MSAFHQNMQRNLPKCIWLVRMFKENKKMIKVMNAAPRDLASCDFSFKLTPPAYLITGSEVLEQLNEVC